MKEMQSLTRNDVFILGAGFSKAASENVSNNEETFPVAAELLDPILKRLDDRLSNALKPHGGEGFEQWLSRLAEDQPYLSPDTNLERTVAFLRVSKEISEILTDHENKVLCNPEPEWLAKLIATWHIRQATVISFNYDNLIEAAVQTQRSWLGVEVDNILGQLPPLPPNLMREEDSASGVTNMSGGGYATNTPKATPVRTFRLLKLHGSISWYWDDGDDSGATLQRWPNIREFKSQAVDHTDDIAKQFPGRVPFIAPPSATKSKYLGNRVLRDFWREALYALQNAENIYFLGYSVPPQDQAAMGLIIEGIGNRGRKRHMHIVDAHADRVRDNLANLLVNYESLPEESKEEVLAKKVTRLKRRYQSQLHSSDDSIKNFADSYLDELATECASKLTDYACSLPVIDNIVDVDCACPNFKSNVVVGGVVTTGQNCKVTDFDNITIENKTLTIPCRTGSLTVDNLALTKLLQKLQQGDVRTIVLQLPRQADTNVQTLVPIFDYRLETNTQPTLHPYWHTLHLTPFMIQPPGDSLSYAGLKKVN